MGIMQGILVPASGRKAGLLGLLLVSCVMSAQASDRGVPVITVGNDPACDFEASPSNHGLAQAINAAAVDANGPGETLIRVANTGSYIGYQFVINLLADQNLTIEGSHVNCSSTTPTGARTLVGPNATPFGPVFRLAETTAVQTVFISGFEIRGGEGSNGGAIEVENNNFLIGSDLLVTSNQAISGGGISIVDVDDGIPTTLWLLGETIITNNDASLFGGGIYCQGEDAELLLDTDVSVSLNTAVLSGGGISLRNGCDATQYASFPDGVYSNLAGSGGGYAVSNGSRLDLIGGESGFLGFGDRTRRTTIDGNRASENGGGILLSGAGSRVRLLDAVIDLNTADEDEDGTGDGGAVWVGAGASLETDRTLAQDQCHDPIQCTAIRFNEAARGGAIFSVDDGTEIDLRQSWFSNNSAEFGSVIYSGIAVSETPPASVQLFIEGNAFVQNALPASGEVIDFRRGNAVDLRYSTFAANADSEFDASISIGTSNVISFVGNVVDEVVGTVFSGVWSSPTLPNSGQLACAVARDFGPLPPFVETSITADPLLDSGFRPSIGSPAIDVCDSLTATPQEPDLVQAPRGVDTAGISNGPGHYDLGAFEVQITTDGVFADRFESP